MGEDSKYEADRECAGELAKASSADEKRDILTNYGWSCTLKKNKSGSRWEYKKGSGRAVSSLAKIVEEISADGVAEAPASPAAEAEAEAEGGDVPARGSVSLSL